MARHQRTAVCRDLQGFFLLYLAIDLLLKPTHLFLQLANEIHYSLTDAVRERELRKMLRKRSGNTVGVYCASVFVCKWHS